MSSIYLTPISNAKSYELPACPPPPRASTELVEARPLTTLGFPQLGVSSNRAQGFFLGIPDVISESKAISSTKPFSFMLKPRPSKYRAPRRPLSASGGGKITRRLLTQTASLQAPDSGLRESRSLTRAHSVQMSSSEDARLGFLTQMRNVSFQLSGRKKSLTKSVSSFQLSSLGKPRLHHSSQQNASFELSGAPKSKMPSLTRSASSQRLSNGKHRPPSLTRSPSFQRAFLVSKERLMQ